jgi:FtsP/CotA-like multicopper oxidase with cupredoxin domain
MYYYIITFILYSIIFLSYTNYTNSIEINITTITCTVETLSMFNTDYNQIHQYERYVMKGSGPLWKTDFGIGYLFVNTSQLNNSTYEIQYYNNLIYEPEIIHAHGQINKAEFDGVPYIQALPIPPATSVVYTYNLVYGYNKASTGTFFIHSHYSFHHQDGMSAPLIVWSPLPDTYPNAQLYNTATDIIMMIEDMCPRGKEFNYTINPTCFHSEWQYNLIHGSVAPLHRASNDTVQEENMCTEAATESDMLYGFVLVNRQPIQSAVTVQVQPQQWIHLRIINGGGMMSYKLNLGIFISLDTCTIIAVDGHLCQPLPCNATNDNIWIGTGQRLDIMIQIPNNNINTVYPIFAIMESDIHVPTIQGAILLYTGNIAPTNSTYPVLVTSPGMYGTAPNYYTEYLYQAWTNTTTITTTTTNLPSVEYTLIFTEDDEYYTFNHNMYQLPPMVADYTPNPYPLIVQYGERVCFDMINLNPDAHSIHVHGHHTLVNGPLRDTVVVPSGLCQKVRICMYADNPGTFPLHCHMSFHEMTGMFTTIEYQDTASDQSHSFWDDIIRLIAMIVLIIILLTILSLVYWSMFRHNSKNDFKRIKIKLEEQQLEELEQQEKQELM